MIAGNAATTVEQWLDYLIKHWLLETLSHVAVDDGDKV